MGKQGNIMILHGEEPYCIDYYKKKAFEEIDSFNIETYYEDFSGEIFSACKTYPFMAEKKGILMDVESMKCLDTTWFKKYCKEPLNSTILVVIIRNIGKNDLRKKLYKEWENSGYIKVCGKITNQKTFRTILEKEAAVNGASFTESGYQEFVKRMNYQRMEDLSLLQIIQIIHTISSVEKSLTKEVVEKYVEPLREPNIFNLSQMLLFKNAEGLKREILLLGNEEPIKILSLLLREYRIAYKLKIGFDKKEIGVGKVTLSILSENEALDGIIFLNDLILKLKNSSYPKEQAVEYACMKLLAMRTTT